MRGLLVLGLTVLLAPAAWASEAQNYTIDLKYDPAASRMTATARIALKPEPAAKSVVFYLHDELKVSAVRLQGKRIGFHQSTVPYDYSYDTKANRIEVDTAGRDLSHGLDVVYAGRFSPSAARSPSDYMRGDRDGLYLRSYGYSLWFPVFAESGASFPAVDFDRVRITAPAEFRAVFVGEELRRTKKQGLATAIWQAHGISCFDAQLTLRRFTVSRFGSLQLYTLKDGASQAAADKIRSLADKLLAYYGAHYRAKAAERTIHMIEEPHYGDIAGANVIGLQEERWRNISDDGHEALTLAHELVHAFVQTPTAASDHLYALEIEGFPSYFHLPAMASVLGEVWYDNQLDNVQKKYMERRASGKDRGETLPPEKPILTMTPDDVGTYKDVFVLNDRALLFWDFLRRKMEQPAFDALVHEMTNAPKVTEGDFFALIVRHAPPLAADAHVWLETTDYPDRFRR